MPGRRRSSRPVTQEPEIELSYPPLCGLEIGTEKVSNGSGTASLSQAILRAMECGYPEKSNPVGR